MSTVPPLVLVTGGAKGIGRAIVESCAAAGYGVVFTYNRSEAQAHALAESLSRQGCSARVLPCDVADPDAVDALAQHVLERYGAPYAVVSNAGVAFDALSASTDMGRARTVYQVNTFACMQLIKALSRPMARNRAGRFVLMSSVVAGFGNRGNGVYASSKAALEAYMRCVIQEFAHQNVTINAIQPGFVDTEMVEHLASAKDTLLRRIPARRFGRPEEIAALVRFLLSAEAGYINGSCLCVDGGLSATLFAT